MSEQFFTHCAWYRRLPPDAQERVLADAYQRSYGTRSIVTPSGELALTWIGVVEGLLKVDTATASGRTVMFCAVTPGAWIGEGALIKKEYRRYELSAIRPTVVAHVPRSTFMWLLNTSIAFNRYIIDHLNERVSQFLGSVELNRIESPVARVAAAISNLFNPVLCPDAGPRLSISQAEIGELAGLGRPTTNVALKRLAELGLVRIEYCSLSVPNVSQLRQFSIKAAGQSATPKLIDERLGAFALDHPN